MDEEITRIYQAINAVSIRIEEINGRLDELSRSLHAESTKKIDEITPYTLTKTAYIDDTELVFTDVPDGNMSVFVKDSEGNYPSYTVERSGDRVTVSFEALKQITTVTISVL